MAEQALVARLLDVEKSIGFLHSHPMSWARFEEEAKTDPDMALLLPAWKEFVEAEAKLEAVIAALRSKHAAELKLK